MEIFDDIDDVEAWLALLDYPDFWQAIEPWKIFEGGERAQCDATIASGIAPQDTVLFCMKAMARLALTERFGLERRIYEPVDAQYVATTH